MSAQEIERAARRVADFFALPAPSPADTPHLERLVVGIAHLIGIAEGTAEQADGSAAAPILVRHRPRGRAA